VRRKDFLEDFPWVCGGGFFYHAHLWPHQPAAVDDLEAIGAKLLEHFRERASSVERLLLAGRRRDVI